MEEHFIFALKKYTPFLIAALFGAIAHAVEKVKLVGWKGWMSFISDLIVCSFVGYTFFQMSLLFNPDYAIIATSIGSYWGTKGFNLMKDWFINSVKANLK